jgi:hypothetical protein
MATRDHAINATKDLAAELLWYGRKEDDDLPRGAIENMLANGELTTEQIVDTFRAALIEGLA